MRRPAKLGRTVALCITSFCVNSSVTLVKSDKQGNRASTARVRSYLRGVISVAAAFHRARAERAHRKGPKVEGHTSGDKDFA